ncbi:hypothetical protein V1460_28930 [Streptomyces sp. SCSIO 30461]|uniref:hypothetical protein n=1 Tax=Streptomyces sp. SCSIO 30461 TaxID=3118085 RepID=UPI0030CD5A10
MGREDRKAGGGDSVPAGTATAMGLSLGLAFGAGVAMAIGNLPIGLGLGMAVGAAVGAAADMRRKRQGATPQEDGAQSR